MSLAIVHSRAIDGLQAPAVTVEVHLANGLPSFTLVGLAETEVKEARERVRAALLTSGLAFPHNKRITVNLAPADLPKESGRFDLPIALGILAASGQIDAARIGALRVRRRALAGRRPAPGPRRAGDGRWRCTASAQAAPRALVLPAASAAEAALVEGLAIHGADHLLDVVRALLPPDAADRQPLPLAAPPPRECAEHRLRRLERRARPGGREARPRDRRGRRAQRADGRPARAPASRCWRSASRPCFRRSREDEALESAAVLEPHRRLRRQPLGPAASLRTPHHSASSVALVGGGSPPRPGEISLAHHGVLFLDELPEFPRAALEALREPLETGRITISRAARQADFPARFQLVAAMNPCPCGHLGSAVRACRCTPDAVLRYQGRISGPLLDRIDLQVEVPAQAPEALGSGAGGEPTATVAARVAAARRRARAAPGTIQRASSGPTRSMRTPRSMTRRHGSCAARQRDWAGRHAACTGCCASPAPSPTWPSSPDVDVPHLAEAIQYRRVLSPPERRTPMRRRRARASAPSRTDSVADVPRRRRARRSLGQEAEIGRGEVRQVREDRRQLRRAGAEPLADRRADLVDREDRQVTVADRVDALRPELREAAEDLAAA